MVMYRFFLPAYLLLTAVGVQAQKKQPVKPPSPVAFQQGRLVYAPDSLGNRIPDFSYCGYKASETPIPETPVKIVVPVTTGDATARIQAALDYVAGLPLNNGIRGAVLLQKGTYTISGQLFLNASGVVLRGSGMGVGGTVLWGAGTDRATLVVMNGRNDKQVAAAYPITDAYVPVNALQVHSSTTFKAGDKVLIQRPCTQQWIDVLGTRGFGGGLTALGWKPDERNIEWERTIVKAESNTYTLDAPLTTALDTAYGGATIAGYSWNGRISNSGIENLALVSAADVTTNPKEEDHRWMAITIENAEDCWARRLSFKNFAGSAVAVYETGRRITVEDCISTNPVSEIGGYRRNTFFTQGQQTLFQRIYSESGYHDFGTGFMAAGPNAFVQCESHLPYSFSGALDSWASGVLFDVVNVDGNALSFKNRGQDGQGAGWAAANSVFWQCTASLVECYQPPTAQNWAFGTWAQFQGNGYWENSNEQIKPRSLYYQQLQERLGKDVGTQARILQVETEASSSPSVEVALALTKQAAQPRMQLREWIEAAANDNPLNTVITGVTVQQPVNAKPAAAKAPALKLLNGWLVRNGQLQTGSRHETPWWRGEVRPGEIRQAKPAVTRFVPGRTGTGLTDNIDSVAAWMERNHLVALDHNYGLWYERRRDDHERIRRMDGDVWAPFYELPFARSGKEFAWDGLSKYDLARYDKWYWQRLKQFADAADTRSLILLHENYFQHNIIEAGAHYADFPWRTANNINSTGFPEPPPYAGDKRIFLAGQFYDITNPQRSKLHKAYIRQCLNNFKGNNSVIQLIGAEFTGPLHFVRFWVDEIAAWEKENNQRELVALSTTKDVQDSILADAKRNATIDVIDIRYWHYQADGTAYAPLGGQNLAPRQHMRLLKPRRTSFAQVYRAVSEYKMKYPAKAVIYSGDSYDQFGWAVFLAGGSLPNLPAPTDTLLLRAAANMKPLTVNGIYLLAGQKGLIAYNETNAAYNIDLSKMPGTYTAQWIDMRSGKATGTTQQVNGGAQLNLTAPGSGLLLWLHS
jgi:hypothetical protein